MADQEHRRAPVSGAEFAGMGAAFAVTILAGLFAGQWLDRRLGTTPILTIGLLFVAAAAGFYSMYRRLVLRQRRKPGSASGDRV
jgi:ATP synthase protein I